MVTPTRRCIFLSALTHRSIFFADVSGALLDAQGRLTAEVSLDQLHFSEIGYAKLAPLLASMIDNLVDRR
jgi:lysophospholipase L1-like esterase